ncbi:MAG: hypothetical protein KH452_09165 [Clostridiales bacterium]|nr:hypothetical protein [Clostridiales bacterium]
MLKKFRAFAADYPHVYTLLYFAVYLPWFIWLESRANLPYHVIHFPLDDYIPFCEYFIIPYFLWFAYVGVVFFWLFFKNREHFYRYAVFLYSGMTIFLIISTLFPNGHLLRPLEFERDNIFIQLVCFLYWADTSTNILPSIHVFNSIAAHMAVMHTPQLRQKKWAVQCSRILYVSIILSTMFLKQHSSIDVILGILLGYGANYVVYHTDLLVKAHDLIGKLVRKDRDLSPTFARKVHRPAEDAEI